MGPTERERSQDSDEASAVRRGRREARGGLEGCEEEKAQGCLGAVAVGGADGWAPAPEMTSPNGSRRQESVSGTLPLLAVPGRTGHLPPTSPRRSSATRGVFTSRNDSPPMAPGCDPASQTQIFPHCEWRQTCATRYPDPVNTTRRKTILTFGTTPKSLAHGEHQSRDLPFPERTHSIFLSEN